MDIRAERENLLEGLVIVSNVASSRTPKPVLQDVRIETKADGVELSSTDLEIGVRLMVTNVEIKEKGLATLPAARLTGISKLSTDQYIGIKTEGDSAVVKSGKSTFNVLGDNPEDFPDIPSFRDGEHVTVQKEVFRDIVKRVAFAAATESTRYALNGVYFALSKSKLVTVAADGKRLAKLESRVKGTLKLQDNVIVPTRALTQFNSMLQDEDKEIKISVSDKGFLAKSGRAELFARLVEGHFPPYEDAIPKEFEKKAEVKREALERALLQAALMTTEDSRAVKLHFDGAALKVTSYSAQTGRAEIELEAAYDGESFEIAFNPGFILDYLKTAEAETVVFNMIDKEKPVMFRDDTNYVYIVMPVSVD